MDIAHAVMAAIGRPRNRQPLVAMSQADNRCCPLQSQSSPDLRPSSDPALVPLTMSADLLPELLRHVFGNERRNITTHFSDLAHQICCNMANRRRGR